MAIEMTEGSSAGITIFDRAKAAGIDLTKVEQYAEETRAKHAASNSTNKANILLYGLHGTGKTTTMITAPKPVHVDCFDRGGLKTAAIKPLIEQGLIIPDNRYEDDWWKAPRAFRLWETSLLHRIKTGYFNTIGTYYLDSITSFADAAMWAILAASKDRRGDRTGTLPDRNDYAPLVYMLSAYMGKLMELPCHVIVTGHLIPPYRDEETKTVTPAALLLNSRSSLKAPTSFDEKWIARTEQIGPRTNFYLQTQPEGDWHAQTRIGGNGIFNVREPQDIRALLKKAGMSHEDNALGMEIFAKKGAAE